MHLNKPRNQSTPRILIDFSLELTDTISWRPAKTLLSDHVSQNFLSDFNNRLRLSQLLLGHLLRKRWKIRGFNSFDLTAIRKSIATEVEISWCCNVFLRILDEFLVKKVIVTQAENEAIGLFFVVLGLYPGLHFCYSHALQLRHVLSFFNIILLSRTLILEITGVHLRL